jgi:hypothetical protein
MAAGTHAVALLHLTCQGQRFGVGEKAIVMDMPRQ